MSLRRTDFPQLQQGIYANTASNGLLSLPLHAWRREQEDYRLRGRGGSLGDVPAAIEAVREVVADFIGTSANRVALLPNFSWGMNAVALSLGSRFRRVAVVEGDYPSLTWPAELGRDRVVVIRHGTEMVQEFHRAIEEQGVDAIFASVVQWIDGRMLPTDFFTGIKRRFPEVLTVADASQYLGIEPFAFGLSGIDVLGTSGYKWLLAGYGNGFFAFSDFALEQLRMPVIGNNSTQARDGTREIIPFHRRLEPGHLDVLNLGSLAFAMDYLSDVGMDRVAQQLRVLRRATCDWLREVAPGAMAVIDEDRHGSIFHLPGSRRRFESLCAKGVECSWRGEGIRISWHFYNQLEDVQGLREAFGED